MIEFYLKNVTADWWEATVGMAPDGISYRVVEDDEGYERMDSLTRLLALYALARDRSPTSEDGGLAPFEITETDDGIAVRARTRDAPFDTTYDELRSAMEPFLGDVFGQLDEKNNAAKRAEGLEFVSTELGIDATVMYRKLMDSKKSS